MFGGRCGSVVDIAAVADIDDEHEQLLLTHQIDDAVASDPIGIPALQLTFEWLALIRVALKVIKNTGHPAIQRRFPLGDAADCALSLVGEFELIAGQGRS